MRLEAEDLAFGYPGKPVGKGVDLGVGAGEVVCLLGPNGAGKTTLFKTLLGLLPAQGGRVLLDGRPLASLARAEVARRIAYVPQAHAAHFPYSVQDMVLMGRTAHLGPFARPGPDDHAAALAALQMLGDRTARRCRLHADQRRPAPARADRPGARPGGAA